MFKKIYSILIVCLFFITGHALAVEVNSADQAELETLTGIGPATARAIIKERDANGPFTDAGNLSQRVRGIGSKSVIRLVDNGLLFSQTSSDKNSENKTNNQKNVSKK